MLSKNNMTFFNDHNESLKQQNNQLCGILLKQQKLNDDEPPPPYIAANHYPQRKDKFKLFYNYYIIN